MRYFFHIGFNGGNYRGWQRQAKGPNIQTVVEDALKRILKVRIAVTGCGRTDANVHASQFFFHVDIEKKWGFDLLFRLNKVLPDDIAIFDIIPVEGEPNARFDATSRTYDYFIHTYKDPFLSATSSLYLETNLDIGNMKRAVSLLARYNDFGALCKTPANHRTTICKIESAGLFCEKAGDRIRFQITANRFLNRMVRIIVGKLLEIGRRELEIDEFESYLITKKTPRTIEPAYPQGLYLSKVRYPFLDIPVRTEFTSRLQKHADNWIPI